MPRIPEVPDDTAKPAARDVFEKQKESYGFVLNPSRIYAHRPSILTGYAALNDGVNASELLDAGLKALVCTRVASINGCPF